MSITIQCSECDHEWDVRASQAGRSVKCPECGESVRVERPGRRDRSAPSRSRRPESSGPNTGRVLLIGGSIFLVGVVGMLAFRILSLPPEDNDEVVASNPATPEIDNLGTVDDTTETGDGSVAVPITPDATADAESQAGQTSTNTDANLGNALNTDRGRELMAAMDSVGLKVTSFTADSRGQVQEAVKDAASGAIEECRLSVRPPHIDPVMEIEMELQDGKLKLRSTLIAKDGENRVKVWERSGTVMELNDSATSAGLIPPNLKRDVKAFFRDLRGEFVDARRQFAS